jgi:hypothetical protein
LFCILFSYVPASKRSGPLRHGFPWTNYAQRNNLAESESGGRLPSIVMNRNWRKVLAIAVLSWSTMDMAGACLHALPLAVAGTSHAAISSSNSATSNDSEGYCDGDCIFCSSVIRPSQGVHLTVQTRVARLEVVTIDEVYDGFTSPIYHPPQG